MGLFDFLRRKPETPQQRSASKPRMHPGARAAFRMFEAAKDDRLTSDWPATLVTSEWLIRMHQRTIVARSREQCANNDYAKAYLRICRQNIVGPRGVMLLAQSRDDKGSLDALANEAIEASFAKWGHRNSCDIAGRMSWRAMQAHAVEQLARDGEFMFRMIYGKDAGQFGFALQILDPQRCHPQFDQYDLPDGSFIRAGIEFNKYGRPLAYHFTVAKESDAFYNYSYAGLHYHRIPADEIIHGFIPEMVGQKRGLPWLHSGLWSLKQLHGFEDAATVAARVGAAKMGVIQWKEGRGPETDDEEQLSFEMTAEPGEFPVLPEGAELNSWNPQYPAGEFAQQVKSMLRRFASGGGVPYATLANDLEGVNFSSIRQGELDSREGWKEKQEFLIETLCCPVFEAWLPRALLGGHITVKGRPLKAERIDRYSEVSWQPRRWAWIDPQADVQAAVASKNNLLQSPGQIIREGGRDPAEVWREIAADIEAMRAAGIPEDYIKASLLDKNLQATVAAKQSAGDGAKPQG